MKIALVISSLGGGGAERVMAVLASAWAQQGAEVTLITLASHALNVYPLDDAVEQVDLDLMGHSANIFQALLRNVIRMRRLRSALMDCRPDVVISFMTTTNLLTVLACRGLAYPVVVSERTFLGRHPPRGVWRPLYRPLYRQAAAVIVQTKRAAADLGARLKRTVTVIPNPLAPTYSDLTRRKVGAPTPPSLCKGDARWLLAVGRLSAEKGFDLLITAFSRIARQYPQWHLVIAGEGPQRSVLTAQVAGLELADRVHLPGFCDDPQALMRQSDLFVLSSRYEGMPNALLEAMAAGCACLSFDCETGPAELIEHGVNGWLVAPEDVVAMTTALEKLMADEELRQLLGSAATAITHRYGVSTVIAQWDALIASVIDESGSQQAPLKFGKAAAP